MLIPCLSTIPYILSPFFVINLSLFSYDIIIYFYVFINGIFGLSFRYFRGGKIRHQIKVNDLVELRNNQVVVSSRKVAENFGKEHRTILRDVREILAAQNCAARFFQESTYENRGKQYPEYLMNRDGFSLLVMGFTGKKALEWKLKYIDAFNQMEEQLRTRENIIIENSILTSMFYE